MIVLFFNFRTYNLKGHIIFFINCIFTFQFVSKINKTYLNIYFLCFLNPKKTNFQAVYFSNNL